MTDLIAFFIPLEKVPTVTAQQAHRTTTTGHHYTDPKALAVRDMYRQALAPHAPDRPLAGAVRLMVKFLFPLTGHRDGQYKTSRPDTDNLIKILKDAMTDVRFWTDDAQVASEIVEKFHAATTGVYVSVQQLEG
jgi:Holliday junction resolvase RusA-like endonuclease